MERWSKDGNGGELVSNRPKSDVVALFSSSSSCFYYNFEITKLVFVISKDRTVYSCSTLYNILFSREFNTYTCY